MTNKFTLRYTGGLVPDVCQQFTKGQGVFTNPTSKAGHDMQAALDKRLVRQTVICMDVRKVIRSAVTDVFHQLVWDFFIFFHFS